METLQLFLVLSLLGGLRYPVTTAIHGVCWAIGRVAWAAGYTSGNPIDRYSNPLANLIWFGLIGVIATTVGLAIGLLGGPA